MRSKGFTIVEILVAVVILGIIAAIAIPVYNNINESAKDELKDNKVQQIELAAEKWADENNLSTPITIPVLQLVMNGYLSADDGETNYVTDPKDNSDMKCDQINIKFENNIPIATYSDKNQENCEIQMEEEFDGSLEVIPYGEKKSDELAHLKLDINDKNEVNWTNRNVYLLVTPKEDITLIDNTITYSGSGINETKTGDICTSIPDDISTCANIIKVSGDNINAEIYISTNTNKGYKNKKVIVRIDKSKPEIIVEIDNTNYTSSDRKVLITTNDGNVGSGISKVTIKGPNDTETKENQGGEFIFYKDNGLYEITITDHAGNIIVLKDENITKVDKVDKKAPVIGNYTTNTANTISNIYNGAYYYQKITRTTTITDPKSQYDDNSKVAKVLYCTGVSQCNPTTVSTSNSNLSVTLNNSNSQKQMICTKAIDNVGNESAVKCDTGFIIDNNAPILTVSVNNNTYINTERTINIHLTDGTTSSGIASFYILDSSGNKVSLTTNSKGYSYPKKHNGTYTIIATDRAGNTTKKTTTVSKVDTTLYTLVVISGTGGSTNITREKYLFGTKLDIVATPDHNYEFDWYRVDNGNTTSITSTYNYSGSEALGTNPLSSGVIELPFTMPQKNVTVEFKWKISTVVKYRTSDKHWATETKIYNYTQPGYPWKCTKISPCDPNSTEALLSHGGCTHLALKYSCTKAYTYYGSWSIWTTNWCSTSYNQKCESAVCRADSPYGQCW